MRAALEHGPLTIAGNGYSDLFMNFGEGILDATMGCPTKLNHAMTLVGYEVEMSEETVLKTESRDHCEQVEVKKEVKTEPKSETWCRGASWYEYARYRTCYLNRRLPYGASREYLIQAGYRQHYCCYDISVPGTSTWTTEMVEDPDCETKITETVVPGEPEMGVWVIQNSWASTWGDNGFIRVEAIDGVGVCGVNFWTQAVIAEEWDGPIVEKKEEEKEEDEAAEEESEEEAEEGEDADEEDEEEDDSEE